MHCCGGQEGSQRALEESIRCLASGKPLHRENWFRNPWLQAPESAEIKEFALDLKVLVLDFQRHNIDGV